MNNPEHTWMRLLEASRQAPPLPTPADDQPPHGFATRVASIWSQRQRQPFIPLIVRWRRAALCGMAAAAAALIATQALSPEPRAILPTPEIVSLP